MKAASVGAREITFAAAAATAAIVAIFLPVAFMKGIIGKFFFQFGVTISVAVLISLLEALTLAPMRCSRFLEVGRAPRHGSARASTGPSRAWRPRYRRAAGARAAPPRPGAAGRRAAVLRALAGPAPAAAQGVRARPGHEPLPGALPDAGGHEPRRHRPRLPADRGLPAPRGPRWSATSASSAASAAARSTPASCSSRSRTPASAPPDPQTGRPLSQQEFMDVVRARAERASPARACRAAGSLAAGLQRDARRRLPGRADRARARLGRRWPSTRNEIMERDARDRPGDATWTATTRSACPRCR